MYANGAGPTTALALDQPSLNSSKSSAYSPAASSTASCCCDKGTPSGTTKEGSTLAAAAGWACCRPVASARSVSPPPCTNATSARAFASRRARLPRTAACSLAADFASSWRCCWAWRQREAILSPSRTAPAPALRCSPLPELPASCSPPSPSSLAPPPYTAARTVAGCASAGHPGLAPHGIRSEVGVGAEQGAAAHTRDFGVGAPAFDVARGFHRSALSAEEYPRVFFAARFGRAVAVGLPRFAPVPSAAPTHPPSPAASARANRCASAPTGSHCAPRCAPHCAFQSVIRPPSWAAKVTPPSVRGISLR